MSPVSTPEKLPEKPSYFRMAFANPYNLSLLGGAIAAAAITLNPILALAAVGVEGLWLLHAPDSRLLRKLLWDPQFERSRTAAEMAARAERLAAMPQDDRDRCGELFARQQEINRLASQNPSFTGDLLRGELAKTSKLVDAFVELAITCGRYEDYLKTVSSAALDRDRRNYEQRAAASDITPQEREMAKKNIAVIMKRIDKLREIHDYLGVARSQLDLIENSFRLIADQIVTMQSPAELSGQLDDLLDGVESIKQTAADTEKILNTLEA
jgi:hypothetical protein